MKTASRKSSVLRKGSRKRECSLAKSLILNTQPSSEWTVLRPNRRNHCSHKLSRSPRDLSRESWWGSARWKNQRRLYYQPTLQCQSSRRRWLSATDRSQTRSSPSLHQSWNSINSQVAQACEVRGRIAERRCRLSIFRKESFWAKASTGRWYKWSMLRLIQAQNDRLGHGDEDH